jgi:hypothetical protein
VGGHRLHAGKLLVRRSVYRREITTPKNRRMREVPLAPSLARELREHRHLRGEFVFCQEDGQMLTRDMIKRVVPDACRRSACACSSGMRCVTRSPASWP